MTQCRMTQVAERGLGLVQSLSDAMDRHVAAGQLPPLFKETWTFSACISLAQTTVRIGPPPPTPQPQTPVPPPSRQASLPPLPAGLVHKYPPPSTIPTHGSVHSDSGCDCQEGSGEVVNARNLGQPCSESGPFRDVPTNRPCLSHGQS